jgi:hypothetical protein
VGKNWGISQSKSLKDLLRKDYNFFLLCLEIRYGCKIIVGSNPTLSVENSHSREIEDYFTREVLPHVPDAWIDYDKIVRWV